MLQNKNIPHGVYHQQNQKRHRCLLVLIYQKIYSLPFQQISFCTETTIHFEKDLSWRDQVPYGVNTKIRYQKHQRNVEENSEIERY